MNVSYFDMFLHLKKTYLCVIVPHWDDIWPMSLPVFGGKEVYVA